MIQVVVLQSCGHHDKEQPLVDFVRLHGPKKGICEGKVEEKVGKW
jgi:hypothetical protein